MSLPGFFVPNATTTDDGGPPAPAAPGIWAHGRALYTRGPRALTHLVAGVVPDTGTVLITGEDKAGKSTLAALLVLCYLHGVPFLGRTIPRPGRAVLVSEEDDADELRDRMRALHTALASQFPTQVLPPDDPASLGLLEDRLLWEARDGLRIDDERALGGLLAQIAAQQAKDLDGPPVLVHIDSLQAVRGLLDPTSSAGVAQLKLALRRLEKAGAVNALIAHVRKTPPGGKRTARVSQEVAANHELVADCAATLGLVTINARPDAPVRVDLVTKRGKSGVLGYLRMVFDPPNTWPPTTITVTLEDAPAGDPRAAVSDRKILVAMDPDKAVPAEEGNPGVPVAVLVADSGVCKRTVERRLNALTETKMCYVTGTLSKERKLYARMTNAPA